MVDGQNAERNENHLQGLNDRGDWNLFVADDLLVLQLVCGRCGKVWLDELLHRDECVCVLEENDIALYRYIDFIRIVGPEL